MELFGVVNASPDSLHVESICTTPEAAVARARWLLANGADHIDLGGQGSTDSATVVPWSSEWQRVADIVPALASLGVGLSIDTWRPEVARRALAAGATILNAADGLQNDAMIELAAHVGCPVVLPFLNGPDPRRLRHVAGDPVQTLLEWFDHALARATRYGIREHIILDPGTGFAPPQWEWADRYEFQKRVYSNLGELRRFGLPIYIALPWKRTAQHDELLDIVVAQQVDYGRSHDPARVRASERRLLLADDSVTGQESPARRIG
jgi:dihydropteroate synthase